MGVKATGAVDLHRQAAGAAAERLGNDPRHELWGEHRSRYRLACETGVRGLRVLDMACGAGFGLQMLRQAGARVVGLDLDAAALAEARGVAGGAPVARADAARLPLPDACLDAVVSFETIEHVPDAAAVVAELRRVLRPGGWLLLSTPNRLFGPPERHTPDHNPYHVREFSAPELADLLRPRFAQVRIMGQRPHPSYRYVPFLLLDSRRDLRAVPWKLANRLPYPLKDGLARAIGGRGWYPGEADYHFSLDGVDGAHALLALAHAPASAT